jgi:hypothetical protein
MDLPKQRARQCLLLCARSDRGGATASADLASLLRQGIDWPYLLTLGGQHRLLPLAFEGLRRYPVPPDVLAQLRDAYHANLRHSLRLEAGLEEAVAALHVAGIEPIVLKGGALAGTVYADPGLRPMVDLDLLVPMQEMERAGAALAAIGYSLSGALPAHMRAFQQRFGGGLEWLRQGDFGVTRIDLQHDLVGVDLCRHAFAIGSATLRARARPLPLHRGQGLQLSAEDTLIHLCLHPALHHGYASALIGYVDIDRLVAREGSDEFWQRLVERARQFRARGVVFHGLRCTHELLGTAVPGRVLDALAPARLRQCAVAWLAPPDGAHLWARTEQRPSGVRQLLLYTALMERLRDALGMVRAILVPGREWLALRYGLEGERQARLYGLVHPFRVARAFLRGLRRPLIRSSLE